MLAEKQPQALRGVGQTDAIRVRQRLGRLSWSRILDVETKTSIAASSVELVTGAVTGAVTGGFTGGPPCGLALLALFALFAAHAALATETAMTTATENRSDDLLTLASRARVAEEHRSAVRGAADT